MGGLIGALILVGIGLAPTLGLRPLVVEFASSITGGVGTAVDRAQLWYVSAVARKIVNSLYVAAAVHFGVLLVALHAARSPLPALFLSTAAAVLAELALAIRQRPSVARLATDEGGRPLYYPPFLLDDYGHAVLSDLALGGGSSLVTVDAAGEAFDSLGRQVSTAALIPHPLAGRQQIAEHEYHPERLQTVLSVAVVMTGFLSNAVTAIYLGAALNNLALLILGMANAAIAFLPFKAACELAAALLSGGARFMSFFRVLGLNNLVSIVGGRQLPDFWDHDQSSLDHASYLVRKAPNAVLAPVLSAFCWILIFRSTAALGLILMGFFIFVLANVPLSLNGGSMTVLNRWYKLTLFQSIVAPPLALLRVLWDFTPEDSSWSVWKRLVTACANWILDFGSGHVGIGVGSWGSIIGTLLAAITFGFLFLWIGAVLTEKEGPSIARIVGHGIVGGACILFAVATLSGARLVWKTQGANEIRLPVLAPVVNPLQPPRLVGSLHASTGQTQLTWTADSRGTAVAFRVDRAPNGGNFAEMARLPSEISTWIDESAEPNVAYAYRVIAIDANGDSATSNEAVLLLRPAVTPRAAPPNAAQRRKQVVADTADPAPPQ